MAGLYGICGGSGAGKTTLAVEVIRRLGTHRVAALAFDAYYHDHGHLSPADRKLVNYDHPDSLDVELFTFHLHELRAGRSIEVPEYDFATHTRTGATIAVEARDIVIVEGILLFAFAEIRDALDHLVFIDVPEEIRLERRVQRDVVHRGREPDDVRRQFAATVAPMHDEHVQPHRDRAHRIIGMHEDLATVADELAAIADRPAARRETAPTG